MNQIIFIILWKSFTDKANVHLNNVTSRKITGQKENKAQTYILEHITKYKSHQFYQTNWHTSITMNVFSDCISRVNWNKNDGIKGNFVGVASKYAYRRDG